MARRSVPQPSGRLEAAAASVGAALGRIARRVDSWKHDRAQLTQDINGVITRAQTMLREIDTTPPPEAIGSLAEIAKVTSASPARRRRVSAPGSRSAPPVTKAAARDAAPATRAQRAAGKDARTGKTRKTGTGGKNRQTR